MGIAAGMRDIVQDIIFSNSLRMAEVKELKKEANEMLGSFKTSQDKMGAQLREDLARDKAKMRREGKAMRNGFQSSHKEMSSAVHQELAEHTQGVRSEVARLRQGIGASHQDMRKRLRKDLAQGAAAGKSEVKGILNDFQTSRREAGSQLRGNLAQGAAACKSEVKGILNDFQISHKQMGAQLRKELTAYDRGIESEVAGMRQETIADMKEARTAWQGLASTMPAKRSEAEIPPKAEAPVAEVTIDLEAKMLAAVNEHSVGITLAGIADSLGIAPVVLGKASKSLLKKGEIRKNGKFYFPVSAE